MYFNSSKLEKIMEAIDKNFWPTALGGKELETKLSKRSRIVVVSMVLLFLGGGFFAFGYLSENLVKGKRDLPFPSWFPFSWTETPYYQIIYVTQWLTNMCFIFVIILAHDYLFMSLSFNCIVQFELLQRILRNFGKKGADNKNLLGKCIRHHQILLK